MSSYAELIPVSRFDFSPWYDVTPMATNSESAPRILALNHYPGLVSVSPDPQVWINYALNYFGDGTARYRLNGTDCEVGPGTAILFRPGDILHAFLSTPEGLDVYAVVFGYAVPRRGIRGTVYSDEIATGATIDRDRHLPGLPSYVPALEPHLAGRLLGLFQPSRPGESARLESYNAQLAEFLSLYRQSTLSNQGADKVPADVRIRVERTLESVENNPGLLPNNDELARQAGLSTPHFERVVRLIYDSSPQKLLTRRRMDYVKQLLINTDLSVADIAEQVGYANPNVLSNAFERECGSRPSSFRSYQRLM